MIKLKIIFASAILMVLAGCDIDPATEPTFYGYRGDSYFHYPNQMRPHLVAPVDAPIDTKNKYQNPNRN
jgi:uncharacterized lipoprotein